MEARPHPSKWASFRLIYLLHKIEFYIPPFFHLCWSGEGISASGSTAAVLVTTFTSLVRAIISATAGWEEAGVAEEEEEAMAL